MNILKKDNLRKPYVSGIFYKKDKEKLYEEIDSFFKTKIKKSQYDKLIAGIAPHAGYFFSGIAFYFLYKNFSKTTKRIVILGFSHKGLDTDISTSKKDWETPIGIVKSDKEIIEKIIQNKISEENNYSIENEHSIEIQIPIIKYLIINKKLNKNVKIIPLSIPEIDYSNKAKEIIDLLEKEDALKDTVFIASSDFIHYGSQFGYTPFNKDVDPKITMLDNEAIELILNKKSKDFIFFTKRTKATICGINPIAFLIEIVKLLKLRKGKLLKYYKSSDIIKDEKSSVSYASIGFFN